MRVRSALIATSLVALVQAHASLAAAQTAPPQKPPTATAPTATGATPPQAAPPAAPPTAPPVTMSQSLEEAKMRYQRGAELYADGDYQPALIEFERAYELAPNFRILYNIGQVHFQLLNYSAALRAFERYLKEGADQVPPERRKQVEEDLKTLRGRTATLRVEINVDGAEVYVDDVSLGKFKSGETVLVNAGMRKLTAQREGYQNASQTVRLAGGDNKDIVLELHSILEQLQANQKPTLPTLVYVGWGTTAALAVGAVVTGVVALGKKSDANGFTDTLNSTPQTLDATKATIASRSSAESSMKTFSILTDVLAGCAIVAGGTSLYFTLNANKKNKEKEVTPADTKGNKPPAAGEKATSALRIGPNGALFVQTF